MTDHRNMQYPQVIFIPENVFEQDLPFNTRINPNHIKAGNGFSHKHILGKKGAHLALRPVAIWSLNCDEVCVDLALVILRDMV